jgi:hypothetical protein
VKTTLYGRILFGLSAIVAGVVMLIRHDSTIWQRLQPVWMPVASIIVWCFALALIASGFGLMHQRTVRLASIVLGTIYLIFSLACFQDIFAHPTDSGSYVEIFELFSVACGALALYALTATNTLRPATIVRVARLGFGVCSLSFAWAQVAFLQYTASLVPAWIPPNQTFWTIATTVAFLAAAIAMLINVQAILAFRLSALMIGLFGLIVWVPHLIAQPMLLSNWTEISENYLMTAAAWVLADASLQVEAT